MMVVMMGAKTVGMMVVQRVDLLVVMMGARMVGVMAVQRAD